MITVLLFIITSILWKIKGHLESILFELRTGIEERKNLREELPRWEEHLYSLNETQDKDLNHARGRGGGAAEWNEKWGVGSPGERIIQDLKRKIGDARRSLSMESQAYEARKSEYLIEGE